MRVQIRAVGMVILLGSAAGCDRPTEPSMGPPQHTAAATVLQGLLAHYSFNTLTPIDNSGNGYHGTTFGMSDGEVYTDGVIGKALRFDGIDDYLSTPAAPTNSRTQGTVSLWMRTGGPTTNTLCGRPDLPNHQPFHCHYNIFGKVATEPGFRAQLGGPLDTGSDRFYFQVNGESAGFVPSGDYGFSSWHMYTFTWDANSKKIYFDGVLKATFPGGQTSPATGELLFGNNGSASYSGRERLKGDLDEIRVYDTALTQQEVETLFQIEGASLSGESQ